MKRTTVLQLYTIKWALFCALGMGMTWLGYGQTVSTTTVQGTVYLANGAPASGTLQLSWPAFNPPGGAAVAAGQTTVTIGADGFFSVNLAPNLGSTPAGLFYTAIYHLSDGTTSAEYSRNAAHALADAANDPGAVWNGSCTALANSFVADVNPGDAVRLNASSSNYSAVLVAETVEISYTASYPDIITYRIAFANDWAGGLGIRTTENLPTDVLLPAANGLTVLPNLSGVSVTSISGATVTIDTGAAAPAGGGFEIRKRDNAFGLGETSDLVLRASTSTMSLTRTSATDRFYIRMYDDSAPPNYSEFSAALFFNMPLGS